MLIIASASLVNHCFYFQGQDSKAIYNDVPRNDLANSFSQCSSYGFVSYDMIKPSTNLNNEHFWLGILRRPIIHHSAGMFSDMNFFYEHVKDYGDNKENNMQIYNYVLFLIKLNRSAIFRL